MSFPAQFRIPSPQPPSSEHRQSSPVKPVAQHFAEHKRDEVQDYAYNKNNHQLDPFKTKKDFLGFLAVSEDTLQVKIPTEAVNKFSLSNFVPAANALAKSMNTEHFANEPLLVFKSTGNKPHRGHVTDTQCKPDITAAFEAHWENNNTTLWPCIRLAGEQASKGKSKETQRRQAMSYLHYLLLARPDLYVAQGLLTSKNGIMFFFGIGGRGIRRFSVCWKDKNLYKLMYAFVYRLYDPGYFGDPSYVAMVPDLQKNLVAYTIRITVDSDGADAKKKTIDCPGFSPIYARNPYESRTHILSNPTSDIKVGGKVLKVVKDQLCRIGTRFDEHTILTLVHTPEEVPGVVEAVFHELVNISPLLDISRAKHRLGLRQTGSPITSVPTLKGMLEMVFDVLEVLRYLRVQRKVLHRDISKGNVLYIEEDTRIPPDAGSGRVKMTEGKEIPLCFIKYLLGGYVVIAGIMDIDLRPKCSSDPHKTSVLLIDFNHAEHLESMEDSQYKRTTRTGTPIFIARAVEQGTPVMLPEDDVVRVPAVPDSPEAYTLNHPERIRHFPLEKRLLVETASPDSINRQWRHELDHDAESVFWLFLFWAVGAQPIEGDNTKVKTFTWASLTGNVSYRIIFLEALARGRAVSDIINPHYEPLLPLLSDLAAILVVDRHWLADSETRNNPEYVPEAFQRLILKFILENADKEFMTKKVRLEFRKVEGLTSSLGLPSTSSSRFYAENILKRPSPEPPKQQTKRRRVAKEMAKDEEEDYSDEDDNNYSDFMNSQVDSESDLE